MRDSSIEELDKAAQVGLVVSLLSVHLLVVVFPLMRRRSRAARRSLGPTPALAVLVPTGRPGARGVLMAALRLRAATAATAATAFGFVIVIVVDDDHFAGPRFRNGLLRHLIVDVLLNLEKKSSQTGSTKVLFPNSSVVVATF